jgi:hypothetical protein
MLSRRLANIVFTILIIAACAYFAWVAEGFKAVGLLASSGLPSKFFPQVMLAFTAVCAVIVLYDYTKGRETADEVETVFESVVEARRGLLTLVATVASYVIWQNFGYVAMIVLSGAMLALAMGVRNPVIYAVNLALAGGIYLVFTQLLGTQF